MDTNSTILVVDDNKENLRVVSNYLDEKGYHLALALSGKDAFEILERNRVDLILLDVMMPEMDGFEVCKKLKANQAYKNIPVIFLTAKNEIDDIVEGFKAGGVDYITKPFNQIELHVRVNNHLQLKKARDLLIERNKETIESRDLFMKTLYDLGKIIGTAGNE